MQHRWALRFWPDTRAMVADDIGIAPDNPHSQPTRLQSGGATLDVR
jgi:hypothetical protein